MRASGIDRYAQRPDSPCTIGCTAVQIRESFDTAADEMWRVPTEGPVVGVMSCVIQAKGEAIWT